MLEILSWITKPNGTFIINWVIYPHLDWDKFELDPRYPKNPLFDAPKFVVRKKI
jgi:hypothetical protein